jgi:hypothetical protein
MGTMRTSMPPILPSTFGRDNGGSMPIFRLYREALITSGGCASREESDNYMGTRISARTTNRDEAQTCISDQHSGHRYCVDLSRAPPGFFEKARCFSRCKMSLMALFGPEGCAKRVKKTCSNCQILSIKIDVFQKPFLTSNWGLGRRKTFAPKQSVSRSLNIRPMI